MPLKTYYTDSKKEGLCVIDISLHTGLEVFRPSFESYQDYYKNRKTSFAEFKEEYIKKMRKSYKRDKPLWNWILGHKKIIFGCDCGHGELCHARILAKEIFTKLGAECCGALEKS
jgi:uncharacterized protein YeaO (DUF488 family)